MNWSAAREIYGHLYRDVLAVHDQPYVCIYCGEPGLDADHVPPVSRVAEYRKLYGEPSYLCARACSGCNSLLGSSLQPDIFARIDALKARLRRRYADILATPSWTDEELTHLHGWLQTYVMSEETKRRRILARIAFNGGYVAAVAFSIQEAEDTNTAALFSAALASTEKRSLSRPCRRCGGPRVSGDGTNCSACYRKCIKCGGPKDRFGSMCSGCFTNGLKKRHATSRVSLGARTCLADSTRPEPRI